MLAVDHVSTSKGKALAGATGAKPFDRGSENLNIYPEGGETGVGVKAIFTDPKCLQVQRWSSFEMRPDVLTHISVGAFKHTPKADLTKGA